jgi:beta-N-acetylhexosaminidase
MRAYDLLPFAAAVEAGVDGVMVAHISYPLVDDQDIASMSSVWINDILRGDLGFEGIVMSDDFRMEGLTDRYSVEDAAVRFLLAGGDLILCGPRHALQTRILDALHAAAAAGTLTEARVNESVVRILRAKCQALGTDWLITNG